MFREILAAIGTIEKCLLVPKSRVFGPPSPFPRQTIDFRYLAANPMPICRPRIRMPYRRHHVASNEVDARQTTSGPEYVGRRDGLQKPTGPRSQRQAPSKPSKAKKNPGHRDWDAGIRAMVTILLGPFGRANLCARKKEESRPLAEHGGSTGRRLPDGLYSSAAGRRNRTPGGAAGRESHRTSLPMQLGISGNYPEPREILKKV